MTERRLGSHVTVSNAEAVPVAVARLQRRLAREQAGRPRAPIKGPGAQQRRIVRALQDHSTGDSFFVLAPYDRDLHWARRALTLPELHYHLFGDRNPEWGKRQHLWRSLTAMVRRGMVWIAPCHLETGIGGTQMRRSYVIQLLRVSDR